MSRTAYIGILSLLLVAGLGSGCNIFDFAFNQGDTVEALLDDARLARSNGDYDRAVDLLEQALEQEPSNPVLRYELASTLMRREGLDLFTVEQLMTHLRGSRTAPPAGMSFGPDSCTFAADASTEPFDPAAFDAYEQIAGAGPILVWVLELLIDPSVPTEAPAMPAALTDLNICDVLTESGLEYNRQNVLDALYNQFGDDDDLVTGALTVNAVALTLLSYLQLFEQPDLPVNWFMVNGNQIGACVATDHYDLFISRARNEVQRAGQALISLDMLMHHSGHTHLQGIVDDAIDFYHILESDELNPCGV